MHSRYAASCRTSSPLTRGKQPAASGRMGASGLIPAHAGKTRAAAPPPRRPRAHPRSRGENPKRTDRTRDARRLIPAHAGKTASVGDRSEAVRAHPRSRGENSTSKPVSKAKPGSSPLTRGKRAPVGSMSFTRGLIPAHAGKTSRRRCRRWRAGAHPRSRGENPLSISRSGSHVGSSPLTRGKRAGRSRCPRCRGLIPAHAGKTFQAELEMIQERAHPRSRGENASQRAALDGPRGSSPLTRGKHAEQLPDLQGGGLIPAHAGKTRRGGAVGCRPRAHPRSRGENLHLVCAGLEDRGSSPLTRGKLVEAGRAGAKGGLIPAHAGKTGLARYSAVVSEAHPRSRGENEAHTLIEALDQGSSPLTRGKLDSLGGVGADDGLIPAHAGKTCVTPFINFPVRAHPRSRGENSCTPALMIIGRGSSPLTRGKRGQRLRPRSSGGLIPAHAGKTSVTHWRPLRSRAHPRSRGENA